MQSSGLLWKYKVNRPLTDDERAHQLKQKEHLDVEPIDQLSVIKANSTYLEVVDKYYAMKGWHTMGSVVFFSVFFGVWIWMVIETITAERPEWGFLLFVSIMMIPFLVFILWGFLKESFTYTHYPVRFNRKTRMVHIFMTDGRQLSVPWDDIFFYLAAGEKGEKDWWDLRGHILDKDGKAVVDTFAMMMSNHKEEGRKTVVQQWELVRRYMEEDYIAIINSLENCMPIDGKYETWTVAWNYMVGQTKGAPIGMLPFLYVIFIALVPFRMLAMHSSKLPIWNKEIEAANIIEPDDMYVKDSRINPEGLR